ncbi:MAG: MBL fold metallo-hydrolase, partial [Myxococcales bacterium]
MFTRVQAGPYSVRGVSVGGVYTCLQVPELSVVLDAGIPVRSFAGTDRVLLSHCHADHASGLGSLLGIRRLLGKTTPPRVFVPAESAPLLEETLRAQARLHACPMDVTLEPLQPGDERE